jgi:hypothetical protein
MHVLFRLHDKRPNDLVALLSIPANQLNNDLGQSGSEDGTGSRMAG